MKNNLDNTICAIASGLTESGIGVIRVSGKDSINIVQKIFFTKNKKAIDITTSHKIYYGFIFDKEKAIDEVLVLTMKAPRSFTAEDTVEIHAHGGILILQNILNLLIENGAVLAMPGEFTKRAFLNGRIDLIKAQSIADFISSQNELSMKASFKQLKGDLSDKINEIKGTILEANAFIEAALDDPEHIEIEGYSHELKPKLNEIKNTLNTLIESYNDGKIIKEGIKTVILGKPNAGKSSLLNALMKKERAIVTNIAGTTRDTLEESINMQGFTLNIVDTAGIRNENEADQIEKIGIEKALSEAKNADLILYLIDANELSKNGCIDSIDKQNLDFIEKHNLKHIILLNKIDIIENKESLDTIYNFVYRLPCEGGCEDPHKSKVLSSQPPARQPNPNCECPNSISPIIEMSITQNIGIDELKQKIKEMFFNKQIAYNDELFITNERHKNLLINAKNYIEHVIESIDEKLPEDFLTIDLMGAYSSLSEILGEEVGEDLINEIFSKFCMGK